MEVRCEFDSKAGYCCLITSYQIFEGVHLKLIGNHKEGKTDNDVVGVKFNECYITKVPQGLTKKFPNLNSLSIANSNLKTVIKSDLIEYKNLKTFDFSHNEIEFLPGDLFEGFRYLEKIFFAGNKLSLVEPNILDGLENLKSVNLNGDTVYGTLESVTAVSNWNPNLKQIKNAILDNLMENEAQIAKEFIINLQLKIQTMKQINENFVQQLQQKCENLEEDNNKLDIENRNLKTENGNLKIEIEDLNDETNHLNNIVETLTQENRNLKAQQVEITQQNQDLQNSCENFKQELENLKAEIQNKKLVNQQGDQKFSNDFKTFIQQDETFKDFRIQINDREFPVHKFLLAARSPTLAEILRNNPGAENLNLVDISVETFEKILKFLYTDELPREDGTNFLHLFAAAGKLKIEELMDFAAQKVMGIVDAENALEVLNLGNKYEHDGLKQKAFKEIKKKYPESKFKDEMISDFEKVEKLFEVLKKMEEAEKSIESFS